MKTFVLLLVTVLTAFAQYSASDFDLVKTTFLREFNREVLSEYLNSGEEKKINAALLSIAQSEDTTFIEEINGLDFEKYGELIAFALGEIGPSQESSDYLIQKLRDDSKFTLSIYEALGKIGDEEDLYETIEIFNETKSEGFPLAVYNFHVREIIDTTFTDVKFLLKNLKLTDENDKLFRSLFTLYRVAPDQVKSQDLELILNGNFDPAIKTYALGILRKNKSFPFPFSSVQKLIDNEEWSLRCEAARTVCYYDFKTEEELNEYTKLLYDSKFGNPNVEITAANSLNEMRLADEGLKNKLIELVELTLIEKEIHPNAASELVLYLKSQKPEDELEILNKYGNKLNAVYKYTYLSSLSERETAFDKLQYEYKKASSYDKFFIFSNIGALYDSLKNNEEYSEFILNQYSSNEPMVITLTNYTIDSSFAVSHSDQLKASINKMFEKKISNSNFNSALSSVFTFTDYIDSNFTKELLSKISCSSNFDLQYDLRSELELTPKVIEYRSNLFSKLFSKSFEYSKAYVETSKGNFTIEFIPEVAPISVGNFIYLTEQGYFDGVLFHRVVPNFVIQTGDKTGTGWSGPAHTIVSEFSPQPFNTNYVGMASSGKDTEGSQWFVMQNNYPHLNGNYTNFGKVIDGFDVVANVDQYDIVSKITLIN